MPSNAWNLQQSLQFAGKRKSPVFHAVEKRLLPHAIAHGDQLLFAGIPQDQRKHAAQMLHEVQAVLFVQMHDDFGVAFRAKLMSGSQQSFPEFAVIVDFTVEDDLYRAVFVAKRLSTSGDINDREPAMPQRHARATVRRLVNQKMTFCVRPAMLNSVRHPLQNIARNSLFS